MVIEKIGVERSGLDMVEGDNNVVQVLSDN
jgi:hypothetical protein